MGEQYNIEVVKGYVIGSGWRDSGWTFVIKQSDGTILHEQWTTAWTKRGARYEARRWIGNFRKYKAPNVVYRELY